MRKVDAPECGTCALRYGAATILDRGSRPQFRKRKTSPRDWSRPSTNRQVDVAFRGPMLSSILTSHKIFNRSRGILSKVPRVRRSLCRFGISQWQDFRRRTRSEPGLHSRRRALSRDGRSAK